MTYEVITEDFEPIMPYPDCPHCGARKELSLTDYGHYEGPVTCYECKGRFHIEYGTRRPSLLGPVHGGELLSPPRPLGDQTLLVGLSSPPIPTEMYRDFQDAVTGLATSPPRMVAVHCRHIVQQALLLKGVADRPPEEMVNIARQKDWLTEIALRSCRAAVFLGGKGAHPQQNWKDQVGPDEAKLAVLATKRVLQDLFNPSVVQDVS